MHAAPCQHAYCHECWQGYVANAVSVGPACLDLRCPDPDCRAAVSIAGVHLHVHVISVCKKHLHIAKPIMLCLPEASAHL